MDVYPVAVASQPVCGQDYSPEDTFASIAAALKALSRTTDDIFSRIDARVIQERLRLQAINQRIVRVGERVAQIAGSTKAVTMFATPKYPATEVARHSKYICLYDGLAYPPLTEPLDEVIAPAGAVPLQKGQMGPDDEVLNRPEKRAALIDLVSRITLKGIAGDERAGSGLAKNGLGSLPSYLPSVCSMLLFNSKENPYKAYSTLEDLITMEDEAKTAEYLRRTAAKNRETWREEESRKLGIAPKSLIDGDNLPAIAQVDFGYKPKMKELEAFALPSNLALPNVADIAWQANLASIAPSVLKAQEPQLPTILDLMPELPAPTTSQLVGPALPTAVQAMNAANPYYYSNTVPTSAPAPMLPGLPADLPPISTAGMKALAAPPPPPPPSDARPLPPPSHPLSSPGDAPPPPTERMGLLAALNNPDNIKKLKKTSPTAEKQAAQGGEDAESKPAASASGGGALSMMDEMKLRLQMKRKAITGQHEGQQSKPSAGPAPSIDGVASQRALPKLGEQVAAPAAPPSLAGPDRQLKPTPSAGDSMFRSPEAMPGLAALLSSGSKSRRKPSDDDWATDSDED